MARFKGTNWLSVLTGILNISNINGYSSGLVYRRENFFVMAKTKCVLPLQIKLSKKYIRFVITYLTFVYLYGFESSSQE